MKKMLLEAQADLESGIAKSLGRAKLTQDELSELEKVTTSELMNDHNLDSIMAEKIMLHAQSEKYRMTYQDQFVRGHVDDDFTPRGGHTRTYPVRESRMIAEDAAMSHDGRMMDYGRVKSDSSEGKMARQALYDIATYGAELHDMLEDSDDLPQWCHYKLAAARESVSKVKHYLEYKLFRKGHPEVE
jgi:hypothetical protein